MRGQSQPSALLPGPGPGIVGFDAGLNERSHANLPEVPRLMRDAGDAEGFSLEMNCPASRYVNDEAICKAVAAMLARINVQVAFPAQGASNHGGFCDERVDALAADARQQLGPGKRQEDFERIWRAMIAQAGYIPLHQQALAWGVRRGSEGAQRPDDVLDLRFVRVP